MIGISSRPKTLMLLCGILIFSCYEKPEEYALIATEKGDTSFPMKPQKILWDVRQIMGPDDILISDVGAHKMWISRYYQCREPNTCLISNGFCTMGFAMPGSLGAKMAFPEKNILSISGDAGFMMNVQELETAVRRKLNVVAMVWIDGE